MLRDGLGAAEAVGAGVAARDVFFILPGIMECEIRFVPSERKVRVARGTSLLEAVQQAGLPVARSCVGEAACARCGLQILHGVDRLPAESDDERRVKARNRIDERLRLACQLRVVADLTVSAPYW